MIRIFLRGKRQYTLDFAYHGGIYRDVDDGKIKV